MTHMSGTYSICYGERLIGDKAGAEAIAVTKKLPWCIWRGQEGVSHTFLTLKDDRGNIIQQIHGSSLDTTRGQLSGVLTTEMDRETQQTRKWANVTLFNRAVHSDTSPLVKLVAIVDDGSSAMLDFLSEPNSNPQVLFEGRPDEVLAIWRKGLTAAKDINDADLPFTAYAFLQPGQSCNSLTRTLMHVMGLDNNFSSPHLRTGFGRLLKDVLKSNDDPAKSLGDLKNDVMQGLDGLMAEADKRFAKKKILQAELGRLL
jgi:hypothetical protein